MEKVREMNKAIFRDNLLMTVCEVMGQINIDENDIRFSIIPVYEKDKSFNGLDDIMRLVLLSEKNVGSKLFTIDETVKLVAWNSPVVPIWINISFNRKEAGKIIFNFETSLRLRKPSLLRNADTGHAPFKAIINNAPKFLNTFSDNSKFLTL
ncbi:hypothetical protein IMSAGC009_01115 [Lachnospiraceae bacterium]|nr:hypothetical protein IMSAGC009_01115 [Lachnospiraceae bacterium]